MHNKTENTQTHISYIKKNNNNITIIIIIIIQKGYREYNIHVLHHKLSLKAAWNETN